MVANGVLEREEKKDSDFFVILSLIDDEVVFLYPKSCIYPSCIRVFLKINSNKSF